MREKHLKTLSELRLIKALDDITCKVVFIGSGCLCVPNIDKIGKLQPHKTFFRFFKGLMVVMQKPSRGATDFFAERLLGLLNQ